MEELIYSDLSGRYFLLDYSPSHSEMVIRCAKKNEYNVDIFLKNVQSINIEVKIEGINIFRINRPEFIPKKNSWDSNYILKITNKTGEEFYIEAGLLVIFQNRLELLESCLGDFTWTEQNKEILSLQIN